MSAIIQLLENNRVEGFHTHINMVHPKGTFNISKHVTESFWHAYCTEMLEKYEKKQYNELKEDFAQKKFRASFNCNQISVLKLTGKWEVLKTFRLDSL